MIKLVPNYIETQSGVHCVHFNAFPTKYTGRNVFPILIASGGVNEVPRAVVGLMPLL